MVFLLQMMGATLSLIYYAMLPLKVSGTATPAVQGGGGEGHGAIVLSPPQTERVVKEVVSKQFKSRT